MLNLKAFRTLQSEDEYNAALKEVRPYFENEPEEGTEEAAHFDALVLLIEQYEGKISNPGCEPGRGGQVGDGR